MESKVWKDFQFRRVFLQIFFVFYLSFFTYVYLKDYKKYPFYSGVLFLLILYSIPLYYLINTMRMKLTYITKDGIRIGNSPEESYQTLRLMEQPKFIKWNEISNVKIIGREVKRPVSVRVINILVIKTNNGKKLECFIAQPKGFVNALKDLKKYTFLTKDSKYFDLLKKND